MSLINYSYISKNLNLSRNAIRKDSVPEKHLKKIRELESFVEFWANKYLDKFDMMQQDYEKGYKVEGGKMRILNLNNNRLYSILYNVEGIDVKDIEQFVIMYNKLPLIYKGYVNKHKDNFHKMYYICNVWAQTLKNIVPKKGFHIDHIVPINKSYKMSIDYRLVGSKENLQYLEPHQNIEKSESIIPKAEKLLKKWNILHYSQKSG